MTFKLPEGMPANDTSPSALVRLARLQRRQGKETDGTEIRAHDVQGLVGEQRPPRVLVALVSTAALVLLTPSPPSLNRPVLSQPVRFSSLRMAGPSNRPPTGPATTRAAALRREPTDITKWAVSGTAALVIATRRDLASVLCVSGAVLNALLAKLLKRLLKEVCHRSRSPARHRSTS